MNNTLIYALIAAGLVAIAALSAVIIKQLQRENGARHNRQPRKQSGCSSLKRVRTI